MKTRISNKTRLKRKLGTGVKEFYVSFIKPRDFSAHSRAHRIMGQIIIRLYVFLSDLERSFFYYFDFSDYILDIREQYPLLPLALTQSISIECQIRHPQNEKGKDVIMTTDLLLTIQRQDYEEQVAVSIKPSSNLNKRTIEKMQIEKKYWNDQNIRWVILTEQQINKIQTNNIAFLRDYFQKENIENDFSTSILCALKEQKIAPDVLLKDFIDDISRTLKITEGDARRSFYHLLATKQVRFDYTKSFNFNIHVAELNFKQNETIKTASLS